jgi:hypothetical protein
MHSPLRTALDLIALMAVVSLSSIAVPVQAHSVDCTGKAGIDLARCERHQKMAEKCGPIKGDAHFACDREFLLAHPLQCGALNGADIQRCTAELNAFKTCEPRQGREFMRCVRAETQVSPMGH